MESKSNDTTFEVNGDAIVAGRNGTFKLWKLDVDTFANWLAIVPVNKQGCWMNAGFRGLNREDALNLISRLTDAVEKMK